MADISRLSRLLDGVQRQVDLSTNTLVVSAVKFGGGAGTDLTKTILDRLVNLQNGTDVDATHHTHDGRYFTETELGSATASSGSDLIGDDATYSNFTPAAATIKGALSGIDTALASAGNGTLKVSANDSTPGHLEGKIVSANSMLTIATLNDAGDEDLQLTIVNSAIDHGTLAGLADDDHTQYHNDTRGDARYYQKSEFVTTATAGSPVKLDGAGKIALAQLPSAIMTYEGVYNATTNTPALEDGNVAHDVGMVYRVSVAGTRNFGPAGVGNPLTVNVGDYVIYNSSLVWEMSDTTDAVASVNGATGVVVLTTSDIAEGTNLYFTDEKAQDAVGAALTDTATIDFVYTDASNIIEASVKSNSISETHLTASVAGDGLAGGNGTALSVNVDATTIEINTDALRVKDLGISTAKLAATSVTAAKLGSDVAGAGLAGGNGAAITVAYSPVIIATGEIAGEAFSGATLYAVRYAQNAETASRIYKADHDATTTDNFHVIGLALTVGALSNSDTMPSITKMGLMTATAHGFTVGKPVYLGASGALTSTAPSTASLAAVKVGMVKDANTIDVHVQVMGVN